MARIRSIKPEFCTSEQLAECSHGARLLFILMWIHCDDAGRHKASVRRLKAECFPLDDIGDAEVTQMVTQLLQNDLLDEYEVDGEKYWQVLGWHHQKIDTPNVKFPGRNGEIEKFDRRLGGKQRQLLKEKIIDRDGETCKNCGESEGLAIDYLIPRSDGGSNEIDNLQLLCRTCIDSKQTSVTQGDAEVTHPRSGREWIGEEGKGVERSRLVGDSPSTAKHKQSSVQKGPPSVDEVRRYMADQGYPDDADAFVDFYAANGWVQGRGKLIKDWRAAVRNWQRNSFRAVGTAARSAGATTPVTFAQQRLANSQQVVDDFLAEMTGGVDR